MLFSMSQNWLLHRVFWAVRVFAGAPVANPITAATAVLPCWSSTTPTDLAILHGTEEDVIMQTLELLWLLVTDKHCGQLLGLLLPFGLYHCRYAGLQGSQ